MNANSEYIKYISCSLRNNIKMTTQVHSQFYSIVIIGIILIFPSATEGNQTCYDNIDCYVKLGSVPSRSFAYQQCKNNGYDPVRIYNKETADLLSSKFTNFWLNIQSHDPGYYSYVDDSMYHNFAGEAPPPSQMQCAFIDGDYLRKFASESVNPNLDYCYKKNRALCRKKNCDQNCLFMLNGKKSWFDSRNECLSLSADLAVVRVKDGVPNFSGPAWIGLRHEIWYYVDNNQKVLFTNWADLHPIDTKKKCVVAGNSGKWINVPCEEDEHDVLCYTNDPTVSYQRHMGAGKDQTALLAGIVTASVILVLVTLTLVIFFLWKRNLFKGGNCACLPIVCCTKKNDTKEDTMKTDHTNTQNSKRQSVRDFISGIKVPNLRKSLFKDKNAPNNSDFHMANTDSLDGHNAHHSSHNAPVPFRKAPEPPIKKKTKPLPPVPRKTVAGGIQRAARPFSELKKNLQKRFSRSQESSQVVPSPDEDESYQTIRNTTNYSDTDDEPKFLDKRQVIPVSDMSLKMQKNRQGQKTPKTPGGSSHQMPPPPSRDAPRLKNVVPKKLPPVPPPKNKPAM